MTEESDPSGRRKFLKLGLLAGGASLAAFGAQKNLLGDTPAPTGKK